MVAFIEFTTVIFKAGGVSPGGRIIVATSQIISIVMGSHNTSVIKLTDGTQLNASASFDDLKAILGVAP